MKNRSAICFLPVIPIRAIASDASEMVSQLLFGETFEVLEENANWVLITTNYDHYRGWIDSKQVLYCEELPSEIHAMTAEPVSSVITEFTQRPAYLPAGSCLPNYKDGNFSLGDVAYQISPQNVLMPQNEDFASRVITVAEKFLGAPYLWGGRTVFGIDCSGFSQLVFKMLGIRLLRDASQQATQGHVVDFLSEAKAGDLAFFDNAEGRVTHVGIMLNNHEIIHASGRVKIDRIDDQGIFSGDLKKYTHKLRIIKRYT